MCDVFVSLCIKNCNKVCKELNASDMQLFVQNSVYLALIK